jgi:integrase
LLPKRKQQVQHLAAMPYVQVPAFLAELRLRPEISARALEFAILTAARPSEALGARWSEIDGNVWTVPADRMKSGRAHRVPLAPRVVELLASMPREGEFIFVGG